MRKIFFVLLALCLFVVPVMAQTPDNPQVINWSDLEDSFIETGYSGKFYDYESLGFRIMIPGGLNQAEELSEDLVEREFIDLFATEDREISVAVTYRFLDCATLEDVAALVQESIEGAQFAGFFVINGLDALMFLDPGNETMTTAFGTTEEGHYVQVSITPITNQEINSLSGYIFGSIQPLSEN